MQLSMGWEAGMHNRVKAIPPVISQEPARIMVPPSVSLSVPDLPLEPLPRSGWFSVEHFVQSLFSFSWLTPLDGTLLASREDVCVH